jgi:hypothetical protein
MGGVYTSPYTATIAGVAGVKVICDDFFDDSYIPETWTTYVTNLTDLTTNSSLVKFQGSNYGTAVGVSLSQTQAYATAAVLAQELMAQNQSTTAGQTAAGELSFAMWGLFDSAAFNSISGSNLTNAKNDLKSAASYVTTNNLTASSFSNVTLYSYNGGGTTCNGGTCPPPPQEFVVVNMPEPSTIALFALDLSAVAGLFVFIRRRAARAAR